MRLFGLQFILALGMVGTGLTCTAQAGRTIAVKLLVDDEEPRRDPVWQRTLQQRVDNASDVLAAYCDVRFSVSCFERWQSANDNRDFAKTLKKFEKDVDPEPAELAIGFSSQYRFGRGRTSLGGTRGPLNTHILLREGSPSILESERLEVLVHELGHFLGAAHSGRADSVMRPQLGDGLSRDRRFRIALDPHNAEVVRLVANEVVDFRIRSVHALSIPTKVKLRNQYLQLARETPRDPVARRYALLMEKSLRASLAQARQDQSQPLSGATTIPIPSPGSPPRASALPR